ncbi:MAG: helix-turn-helix transcriptional regulator [Zoogloeaceae bacterium]|nr:helix-turn-helix transcriptional regulator [Zoogloeaceae bacterium]
MKRKPLCCWEMKVLARDPTTQHRVKMHGEHSNMAAYAPHTYMIPSVAIMTVADLVRAARNGRSQKEFAHELGVRQSSISRYESGKASPPVPVIEHCCGWCILTAGSTFRQPMNSPPRCGRHLPIRASVSFAS